MTLPDVFDAAIVSTVCALAVARRAWAARWAVAGLVVYHVLARALVWGDPDPLPELAAAQLAVAAGYLFGPLLTVYGRLVGLTFVAMSLSSAAAVLVGWAPGANERWGLDLYGAHEIAMAFVAGVIVAGVLRHGRDGLGRGGKPDRRA